MNAFYATQQLFDKAYGNYLGLARLAGFMAREMGLDMTHLTCFVGVAKLERIGKRGSVTLWVRRPGPGSDRRGGIARRECAGGRGVTAKKALLDPTETPSIAVRLSPAKTTQVYDTYWRFAAERQRIFFSRLSGRSSSLDG